MASNINQVVLIVSIASLLLALFPQAESTLSSKAPAVAPGSAFKKPVDAKAQLTRFIESTMFLGMHKTEEYLQAIGEQVNDPATSESTLECLKECKDLYEAVFDDMKNTIEDMESGNYYKVNMDISSIWENVDTCMECYRERAGEDLEGKDDFDKWVMGITNDCFEKLETITS